jgi:hypothetical protein
VSAADPAAADRARDLLIVLLGVASSINPHAVAVSLHRLQPRPLIRILVSTDEALDAVAVDRALGERAVLGTDGGWWREARGQWPEVRVVARGPSHHEALPAETA